MSNEVKAGLSETQKQLDDKAKLLYGELEHAIPVTTDAPATSTLKFLKDKLDNLRGVSEAMTPMERKLLSVLSPKQSTEEGIGGILKQAQEGPIKLTAKEYQDYLKGNLGKAEDVQPTYAALNNMREQVGSALYKKQGVFKDEDSGLLKKLYGSLSQDQENTLKAYEAAHPEAKGLSDLWASAKQTVAARKDVEDKLASLFGDKVDGSLLPKLSGATQALAKGDETKLVNFIKAIPEDQRERSSCKRSVTSIYEKWQHGFQGLY